MNQLNKLIFSLSILLFSSTLSAKAPVNSAVKDTLLDQLAAGLKPRSIGPSLASGRIVDLVVHPKVKSIWYIAAASGGIWKTENAGNTFTPIFEQYGSYSIGCLKMDPKNEHVLWAGTGENNNQRSVGYGDGIYKTEDGGKSWKNMGLAKSEHIGMIAIDPQNSDHVYVAAYGPLWSSGGDRGIYETEDGGNTWKRILYVSENTGFNEIHIDPLHPEILYATAHQRMRHEWTYLGGGPESAIYKSTDKGKTWQKLKGGLPDTDLGRISIAIPEQNSDIVYALIEGSAGGFYVSKDRGMSWTKQSSYYTSGNYYAEIFVDPGNPERIYSMNTFAEVSNDGGKTFKWLGERNKHVDNHVIWVDKDNLNHYLMGCDGGLYETWDAASTWNFKANLPLTQFYRVSADNSKPFYYVYGGTQDNNTLGGPSATNSASGIHNYDWFVTVEGDGFKTVIDPVDPNIVYSQWQYGGLVRHNKKTGEVVDIRPKEMNGTAAFRFNWDAPILISHFDHKTIYYAAQFVFKSTDMGSTWQKISGDLSSGIDRNTLPIMGKVWSMDAVAKNQSTSIYGNITALDESPYNKNLLYAATDDGLFYTSEDGGGTWTKNTQFPGIPKMCMIQNIYASKHDGFTVYAVFNHHRSGDFKPYLMVSKDKGKTWSHIEGNLPERGSVQCFTEDSKLKDLLYCGTEFGMFVSADAGKNWSRFAQLPCIPVREIVVQDDRNDLVIGTFGRGIYILDDMTPLRNYLSSKAAMSANEWTVFPVSPGRLFIPAKPLGHKGQSFQGAGFYVAENPANGAVISYYVRDKYQTIKEIRKEREKKSVNDYYPSRDSILLEDKEGSIYALMTIKNSEGNVIQSIKVPYTQGFHRVVWDGRCLISSAVSFHTPNPDNPYEGEEMGPLAMPGTYTCEFQLFRNNKLRSLGAPVSFDLQSLFKTELDKGFVQKLSDTRRVFSGSYMYMNELERKISFVRHSEGYIWKNEVLQELIGLEQSLDSLMTEFRGNYSLASREFETLPGLMSSLENMIYGAYSIYSEQVAGDYEKQLNELRAKFSALYKRIIILDARMKSFEKKLDNIQFPATPGRLPVWKE